MSEKLSNINSLSTKISTASFMAKHKAQQNKPSQEAESKHSAVQSTLLQAISSTFNSLMRNHAERVRRQNELFEQSMKDL